MFPTPRAGRDHLCAGVGVVVVVNPCGNFSDTSGLRSLTGTKGSLGPAFAVRTGTEGPDQASFCPYALHEISVLAELTFGLLCCILMVVPPQPNSPPDAVLGPSPRGGGRRDGGVAPPGPPARRRVNAVSRAPAVAGGARPRFTE